MHALLRAALTRLAASPAWPGFVAKLSALAKRSFASVKEVIEWMTANKGSTAMIAYALSEVGVSIASFVKGLANSPDEQRDVVALARDMSEFVKVSPAAIALISNILSSDGDKLVVSRDEDDVAAENTARVTLSYIKSHLFFGAANEDEMLEMHAALQLFAQLPRATVSDLMSDRLNPIRPYDRRVMRGYLVAR